MCDNDVWRIEGRFVVGDEVGVMVGDDGVMEGSGVGDVLRSFVGSSVGSTVGSSV